MRTGPSAFPHLSTAPCRIRFGIRHADKPIVLPSCMSRQLDGQQARVRQSGMTTITSEPLSRPLSTGQKSTDRAGGLGHFHVSSGSAINDSGI